jgi:hypothetical protein
MNSYNGNSGDKSTGGRAEEDGVSVILKLEPFGICSMLYGRGPGALAGRLWYR